MMVYIAVFCIIFLLMRLVVAFANMVSRPYLLPKADTSQQTLVSVLIPARNEEHNIERIVRQVFDNNYRHIEVWIYNDQSDDNTGVIVERLMQQYKNLHLIQGKPLPDGWLGKNHACYQLAQKAQGKYLLFLDADVSVQKHFVGSAVAMMEQKQLALLSFFPQQTMYSWGEQAVVPIMNWILLSLLPLPLVRWSKQPSLSAANGQCMIFDAQVYRQHQFHEAVRDNKVEDIVTARMVKKLGYNMQPLLGNKDISCRMYTNYNEALHGFAKNVFQFFGNSAVVASLFGFIVLLGWLPVWWIYGNIGLGLYAAGAVLLQVFISAASKQHIATNLVFMILQRASFVLLLFRAWKVRLYGNYTWKGRKT